jgi:hypothetical protein
MPEWTDALPEGIRDNPVFEKYDGDMVSAPISALNALVDAQKFIGGEKVPVPKNAEDKDAFDVIFKAMGRPDDPKLYELNKPEGLPEDFEIADEDIEIFKTLAHELGLSPGQAQTLYAKTLNGQNESLAKMDTAIGEANTKAEVELRKEWGKAYDHNFALAQKVFNKFGSDAAVDVLDGSIGSNPHILKMFAEIGKAIGEDTLIGGSKTVGGINTPEMAKQKIAEIRADTKHPYHQGDKAAVAYMNQLYELLTAGEPAPAQTETGSPI